MDNDKEKDFFKIIIDDYEFSCQYCRGRSYGELIEEMKPFIKNISGEDLGFFLHNFFEIIFCSLNRDLEIHGIKEESARYHIISDLASVYTTLVDLIKEK